MDEIGGKGTGSARFYAADLASLDEVRAVTEVIRCEYDRLDVLVNIAAIWMPDTDSRRLSEDGYELHIAVNYFSGFLFRYGVLPLIEEGAGVRRKGAQQALTLSREWTALE